MLSEEAQSALIEAIQALVDARIEEHTDRYYHNSRPE
jgi:hypothetical protein